MQLVESRIAKLDEVQSFWIVAGLAATAYCLQRRYDPRVVTLAGLCFGVATACKWNGLFAGAGAWLCFCVMSRRDEESPSRLRPLQVAGIFAVTIASVYVLSYLPLAIREGAFGRAQIQEIVGYHLRMWRFRNDPAQFHHRYQCSFLSWPLVKRPVWFFYEQHEATVRGIVALGSPPFWWIAFLLLLESTFFSWRRSDRAGQFLAVTYMLMWLPWASSSGGGFIYYMLPATPLMAVIVARELADWWQEKLSRRLAIGYCALLVLFFCLFFPLLTALPVSRAYFDCLFFYHGWI
ncbi:unnamed protein product [Phaeothamnion confervicola]